MIITFHFCHSLFQDLQKFIENSLDLYRHELALILYPVFVHMYLELVYNGHEEAAKKFVLEYGAMQETFYQVRFEFHSGNPNNICNTRQFCVRYLNGSDFK